MTCRRRRSCERLQAAFGRKYVTPKDLEEYRVQLGRSGVLLLLEPGMWR